MERDPIDVCLSCYFQHFVATMNFSMDLSDLAYYHKAHCRLFKHWQSVLPPENTSGPLCRAGTRPSSMDKQNARFHRAGVERSCSVLSRNPTSRRNVERLAGSSENVFRLRGSLSGITRSSWGLSNAEKLRRPDASRAWPRAGSAFRHNERRKPKIRVRCRPQDRDQLARARHPESLPRLFRWYS